MIDSCVKITLDIRETSMPIVVKAKRGDTGRKILITLADGGMPYEISEDCYATFTGQKADKTKINNACTIKNNVIEYIFTEQTCAVVGRMMAEIKLYGTDNKMLTSASFILEVHNTVFNEGDIASENEMEILDALILMTMALKEKVEQLKQQGGGAADPEAIEKAIEEYLAANPLNAADIIIKGEGDNETTLAAKLYEIIQSLNGKVSKSELETEAQRIVEEYLEENPIEGGYPTTTEITDESTNEEVPTAAAVREYIGQHSGGDVNEATVKKYVDKYLAENPPGAGVTFIPTVAADGTLSWTNDGGLKNPPAINIRGASVAKATVERTNLTDDIVGANITMID